MHLSVPCPESVRKAFTTEDANNHGAVGIITTITGGLISFEFSGAGLDERLESLTELDELIGLAIADEDRPDIARALSDLKGVYAQVRTLVTHESYRQTRASERANATSPITGSHSHAERNASSDDSSEQHGAEPKIEETQNEQAHEEEQPAEAAGSGRRRR